MPTKDITLLLTHTGKAIQSLAQPTSDDIENGGAGSDDMSMGDPQEPGTVAAQLNPEERLESFKVAMNSFMKVLHSVDVRLKRQIWGLEEAGIITLKGTDRREQGPEVGGPAGAGGPAGSSAAGAGVLAKGSLEPNGVGKMGTLDVGWLNSRSNKVERVMESELWVGARQHLQGIAEGRIKSGGAGVGLGLANSNQSGGGHMEE